MLIDSLILPEVRKYQHTHILRIILVFVGFFFVGFVEIVRNLVNFLFLFCEFFVFCFFEIFQFLSDFLSFKPMYLPNGPAFYNPEKTHNEKIDLRKLEWRIHTELFCSAHARVYF